jgi:hypothetical protein
MNLDLSEKSNSSLSAEDEKDLKWDSSPGGRSFVQILRQNLKLFLLVAGISIVLASVTAFWFISSHPARQEAEKKLVQEPTPLISSLRARDIQEKRTLLRSNSRSSHNEYLMKKKGSEDMLWFTSQAELTLLSGLFNYYIDINAHFFEFVRLTSNDYLKQRWQVKKIFEQDLMPKFQSAERRLDVLNTRIQHDPGRDLYKNISYIAYHDSLAVTFLYAYLNDGPEDDYTKAVEHANTAKLSIKEFWKFFQIYIKEYDIKYQLPAEIWNRYFGSWP